MQIDWITVAAQIANFLVLVWLLQRFLYRPITQAMKKRELEIEKRLAEAKVARTEAKDEADMLRSKQADLKDEKDQILADARQDAQLLRARLETDIREDMDRRRDAWHSQLEDERDGFAKMLRRKAGHQVIAITGQLLRDYAGSDLADEIVSGFVQRLEQLDQDKCGKLVKAAAQSRNPARVECSVSLKPAARARITRAMHGVLKTNVDVEYRQDESLVLGVRLSIGEQTLEWSAARHLKRLESALDEAIDSAVPKRPAQSNPQGA